jgi:hypothetical protein
MADFSTPFSSTGGNNRLPTIDERQEGFPCGPADQMLFNGMFRRLEAELQAIITGAGLTGDDDDDTIVYQSILALIAAATGGSGDFLLMSQARARLPIFPEVLHVDGHLNVTSPGTGQVRVPAGRTFQHRGIYQITTVQVDFATLPSKVYHLRWNPTDGFSLQDIADTGTYNPSSLLETNAAFDSTYDDMLAARVVTNSSNVPTITNLINKTRLSSETQKRTALADSVDWATLSGSSVSLNWARTPMTRPFIALNEIRSANIGPPGPLAAGNGILRGLGARLTTYTRYSIANLEYYYEDDQTGTVNGNGLFSVDIFALAV